MKLLTASSSETVVSLKQVQVRFGKGSDGVLALADVTLEVRRGEFVTVVGPSGCGKSTLLNVISGVLPPFSTVQGEVALANNLRIGYVFQKDALLPWRTVLQNVEVGAELGGVPRGERRARALQLIQMAGLSGFEDMYPHQLSGGMRQRVALIRTLAYDPDIILMDEPFGALDAFTRISLQDELLSLWRRTGKTVVLVTHDLAEAIILGTRLVVLSERPGRVRAELPVELPEPRSALHTRSSKEFLEQFQSLWSRFVESRDRMGE